MNYLIVFLVFSSFILSIEALPPHPLPPGYGTAAPNNCDGVVNTNCGCYALTQTACDTTYKYHCYWRGVNNRCEPGTPTPPSGIGTCNLLTTDQDCFLYNSYCRFDLLTLRCTNGSPGNNIAQIGYDLDYCYRQIADGFNYREEAGFCVLDTISCNGLGFSNCLSRSDCHWVSTTGTCAVGPPLNGCAYNTNQTSCQSSGCFWDPYYTPQTCFNSLAEVNMNNPCSTWEGVNMPTSCTYHNCFVHGTQCLDYALTTVDTGNTIVYTMNVEFTNPRLEPNSYILLVDAIIPLQLRAGEKLMGIFGIGSQLSQDSNYNNIINAVNPCNNLRTTFNGTVGSCPVYPDIPFLKTYFINWVNTFHNFNFDGSAEGLALKCMFGDLVVNENPNDLISNVVATTNYITFTYKIDLAATTATCPTGSAVAQSITQTVYSKDLTYTEVSTSGGIFQTTSTFVITFYTSGIITITMNSQYRNSIHDLVWTFNQNGNTAHADWSVRFSIDGVYDSSKIVGPRNISDISFPIGTNCYGDHVTGLIRLPKVANTENYLIQVRSATRALDTTGSSWLTCLATGPDQRLIDLGNATGIYDPLLDAVHDFQVNSYSCEVGNPSSCILSNQALNGTADVMFNRVFITAPRLINNQTTRNYTFVASYLARPTDLFSQRIILGSNVSNVNGLDPRNLQVFENSTITLLISTIDAQLNTEDLAILVNDPVFQILPRNIDGSLITTGTKLSLNWADIQHLVSYQSKTLGILSAQVPACVGVRGCDGFAIGAKILKDIMPANGYTFTLPVRIFAPTGVNRRLLSTDTIQTVEVSIWVNGTQTIGTFNRTIPLAQIDLGKPQDVQMFITSSSTFVGAIAFTIVVKAFTAKYVI
jgi:hypothetical protein